MKETLSRQEIEQLPGKLTEIHFDTLWSLVLANDATQRTLLRQREEDLLIACSDFQSACQRAESYAAQFAAMTAERDEAVRLSRYAVHEALLHSGHTVVEHTGNVFGQWKQAIQDAMKAEQQLAASQERCANLKDVLQALYDVQNGCPLLKYEKDWHIAMERAQLYLTHTERPPV